MMSAIPILARMVPAKKMRTQRTGSPVHATKAMRVIAAKQPRRQMLAKMILAKTAPDQTMAMAMPYARVTKAGRAICVTKRSTPAKIIPASAAPVVGMAPVPAPVSAIAAGWAPTATKKWTVVTITRVKTAEPATMKAQARYLALALRVSRAISVKLRSTAVKQTPAKMMGFAPMKAQVSTAANVTSVSLVKTARRRSTRAKSLPARTAPATPPVLAPTSVIVMNGMKARSAMKKFWHVTTAPAQTARVHALV